MAARRRVASPSVAEIPRHIFMQTDKALRLLVAKDAVLLTAPLLANWILVHGAALTDAVGNPRFPVLNACQGSPSARRVVWRPAAFPFLTEVVLVECAVACLCGHGARLRDNSAGPPQAESSIRMGSVAGVSFMVCGTVTPRQSTFPSSSVGEVTGLCGEVVPSFECLSGVVEDALSFDPTQRRQEDKEQSAFKAHDLSHGQDGVLCHQWFGSKS